MRFDGHKRKRYNSRRRSTSKRVRPMGDGKSCHGFSPERIHKILGKLGCSQADLARRLGVPRNTFHNWLSGRSSPSAAAVMRLRQVEAEAGIKS